MVPICQTSVDWSNLLYTHPARNKKGMQILLSLPPPEGKKTLLSLSPLLPVSRLINPGTCFRPLTPDLGPEAESLDLNA